MDKFAQQFMAWVVPGAWFVMSGLTFLLGILSAGPLNYNSDKERKLTFFDMLCVTIRRMGLTGLPIFGFILPLVGFVLYNIPLDLSYNRLFDNFFIWYRSCLSYWLFPLGWGLVRSLIRFYLLRYLRPGFSNFTKKIRMNQATDMLSDIRQEKIKFTAKQFNPQDYYRDNQIFMGLNEFEQPIYISRADWNEMNCQVIGPTRAGKGVEFGNLIAQEILQGHAVFYIDPKGDKFIPHIMADFAKKTGRAFYYYNLNDSTTYEKNPGEWAPFVGGDIRARRARLLTAFGLDFAGTDADFHKGREKRIIDELLLKTEGRLPLMLKEFKENPELETLAQRSLDMLLQWSKVKSFSPKKGRGLSIEKSLLNNAVVYVKGSLDDEIVKQATRVMIMEIVQEIKRLYSIRKSHVSLYMDEVRFRISNPLVDALATILGFDAKVILAYQAKNDVRNLQDKSLNAESIAQSINVNCQLKLIYGSQDPDTNEWVESMSGERVKIITRSEQTKVGTLGEETWEKHRMLGQDIEALITSNMMLSLKQRVGVLFQPREMAQIIYTCYVPTQMLHDLTQSQVVRAYTLPSPAFLEEPEQ